MKLSAHHKSLLADKEAARGGIKVGDACADLFPFLPLYLGVLVSAALGRSARRAGRLVLVRLTFFLWILAISLEFQSYSCIQGKFTCFQDMIFLSFRCLTHAMGWIVIPR